MIDALGRKLDCLLDHYTIVCIFLALVIMTWIGVGTVPVASMLGVLLCVIGIAQASAQADLGILLPLVVYNLAGMASSFAWYGNITDGYGAMHSVFPVLYLLMACLDSKEQFLLKRICIAWSGMVSLAGIAQFACQALLQGSARRLGGLLGNPNAMGIFLVMGWFALHCCQEGQKGQEPGRRYYLPYIEPLLLVALALTLSMGSFLAMAVGILAVIAGKRYGFFHPGEPAPSRECFRYACRLLAKASLGIGTGMLLYLAAARTDMPAACLPLLCYVFALVLCWPKFGRFLEALPSMAAAISFIGVFVAVAIVLVRPSSVATFTERLEMMENGLYYLVQSPLLGVGPYRWRYLNLADSDKYFNTWHIHNALLHVGVEFGWIAMGMLLWVIARAFRKKTQPWAKAGLVAFCFHNMIDTSFFYMGITSLALLVFGAPGEKGEKVGALALRAIFFAFALLFVFHLLYYVRHVV
ncbi:hypothetical protein D3Z51_12495 [Clostridiaceae bacterium]|nr:hypothetical protein [Clostridiaceae bacterium]RKI12249.1 hypothetical protein D7V81_12540 [bacterium 1XD21-70]